MEKLIATINKLQDVFDKIGDRSDVIELPEIVVVGSQSAGKSSVMEGIVGKDFLPRGTGVVTRQPLLIRLIRTPLNDPNRKKGLENIDWATFQHTGDKVFTNFQEVRKEIQDETDRGSGKNKGISEKKISLNIYSDKVVNLSLTDLPGITKNPVGDQPKDIEAQIKKMIKTYIENPKSLILAVTPANTDFATSESLSLAREFDPSGERTICVLTKLDIMDRGTNATAVLTGSLIPVKLGIIGVVNRSQADIDATEPKSIQECIADEENYLKKNYPNLADENGIPYLAKTLSELLIQHIRKCLPDLKQDVAQRIIRNQEILATLGEPVSDKNAKILQIISSFSKAYNAVLDGNSKELESRELSCGARIAYIFHDIFANEMDEIHPTEGLKEQEILTAIRNAAGTRKALFIPENSFEYLVKKQLSRLEKPSLKCVDSVYEELLRVVNHCGSEMEDERTRFPRLYERIDRILEGFLSPKVSETKEFVKKVVQIQLAYINTNHPEFNDSELAEIFNELKDDQDDDKEKSKNFLTNPLAIKNKSATNTTFAATKFQSKNVAISFLNHQNLGAKTTEKIEEYQKNALTEREERDQMLIEKLIIGYFAIVQKIIKDIIPKAIMHGIVNEVRDNLRDELVKTLHKSDDIDKLLSESSSTNNRRKQASNKLDALNEADKILNEIHENSI